MIELWFDDPFTRGALSWCATFLVHSTVLLGGIWLLTRCLRTLPDAVQESLWKVALLGGVLTASLQLGLDSAPFAGTFELTPRAEVAQPTPPPIRATSPLAKRGPDTPPSAADSMARPSAAPSSVETLRAGSASASVIAWIAFAAIIALGLVQLAFARLRFRRRIADRRMITEGHLPLELLQLIDRAGFPRAVRLTSSDRIATPIAFGVRQPEICLPTRAIHELGRREQTGMLAHELAHLVRRDPAWLLLGQIAQRLLFVQPLLALARRNMLHLAEYRCDAWAARQTEDGLPLARCLVEVAGWLSPGQTEVAHAPGMAASPSLLRRRVGRILAPNRSVDPPRRLGAALSLVVLSAATASIPGVSVTDAAAAPTQPEPLAPVADLPLAPGLSALGRELSALDAELASLRSALAERAVDAETAALIDRLEQYASELRARRDHMDTLLPATLNAVRATAGREASSTSSDPNGENR